MLLVGSSPTAGSKNKNRVGKPTRFLFCAASPLNPWVQGLRSAKA